MRTIRGQRPIARATGSAQSAKAKAGRNSSTVMAITEAQMKARFPKALVADIVGSLLMAFTLAHLIKFAGAESIGYGGASDFSPGWASSRSPPYPRRSTSTGRPSYG